MSDEEQARLQIAGTPLTVEGEVLEEAEDGFGSRSGRVSGVNDPARAAEIRIRRIVASAFPRLGVEFDVLDADGEPVPDIGAEHFEFREAGVATTHLFRHTDAPTPGVIFLVDKSTSMPSQYRDAGAERVIREIATRVQARWPAARFRTAIVGASGAGVLGWQTDPARVGAEANYFGMGSGLWHAYADAAEAEGTAIVFLTDGVAADENNVPQPTPPDALVARLRAAPPAIMLGTGALGPAFEGLAEITGGVTLDIADPDRAIGAVLEQLERHRGTYTALTVVPDDQAAGERQIQIALPAAGVSATGPYRVPPLTERAAGDGVAGIYLRVQANGVSCTRTLAGVAFGSGETLARRLSIDLLPVTRFATAAETPAESTETTARRSAGLAAYETAIYDRTAAGQLTGELRDSVEAELDQTAAVDRETGTLISVLSDGTGGGVTEAEIERDFKQIIALVEMSGSVGALSAWAKLEKLRIATLIIHRMSGGRDRPARERGLQEARQGDAGRRDGRAAARGPLRGGHGGDRARGRQGFQPLGQRRRHAARHTDGFQALLTAKPAP